MYEANRDPKKKYVVFINPYEVIGDDFAECKPACNKCYYSFDTWKEATECASALVDKEDPECYFVCGRWTTSKPNDPDSIRGFRMNGWSVGINPLYSDADEKTKLISYGRFLKISEMIDGMYGGD